MSGFEHGALIPPEPGSADAGIAAATHRRPAPGNPRPMNPRLPDAVCRQHSAHFGQPPQCMAYAPGRVEILGNHTDYNGGLALAAADDAGICAAVSRQPAPRAQFSGHGPGRDGGIGLPAAGPGQTDYRQPAAALGQVHRGRRPRPAGGRRRSRRFRYQLQRRHSPRRRAFQFGGLAVASAWPWRALTDEKARALDLARLCQRSGKTNSPARAAALLDQLSSLLARSTRSRRLISRHWPPGPSLPGAVVC